MSDERLRFSTEILRRLGEEQNPSPDHGIIELVKNSYDADAVTCTVELQSTHKPGGTVRIADDGDGMTLEQIRNGWLVVGRSGKSTRKATRLKRMPVGSKGLGRLAALRLGTKAVLTTKPKSKPHQQYSLAIDWKAYDRADVVEDVVLELESDGPPLKEPGTTIAISKLRSKLTPVDVRKLARAMVLLADPFDNPTGFKPVLKAPEFRELEELVKRRYFDEAQYHLQAVLSKDGTATATVKDFSGNIAFRADHSDICKDKDKPRYRSPAATFDLWAFNLGSQEFSPRIATLTEIRDWLANFGGVHLYHRKIRVDPYGNPGYDWLNLNLRRAQSPELRPSTNTAIGLVAVTDARGRLVQKTDRVGFVENDTFIELKRFATDALEWMADCRLKEREKRRETKKAKVDRQIRQADKNLNLLISHVAPEERAKLKKAITVLKTAQDRRTEALREELQLYHTLGTVGTTAAAFAHQSKRPLVNVITLARTLEDVASGPPDLFKSEQLAGYGKDIRQSCEALLSFAKVTLGLLEHEKRRRGSTPVHDTIKNVVKLLKPFLDRSDLLVDYDFSPEPIVVWTSKAALESIFTNLLTNSIEAFKRAKLSTRKVLFRTRVVGEQARVGVLDTGPGIKGIGLDDIWLPGKTTTDQGTGLGLTIVKDTVTEMGGTVHAIANGEMGGAEFIISLPLLKD